MGKFNVRDQEKKTVMNFEDAPAFSLRSEVELFGAVVTSLLDDSFYERKSARLVRLQSLMAQVSPEFVCRLAVYARRKMNLRSIPIVLLVELLGSLRRRTGAFDRRMVGWAIDAVILRADEIGEILAYYQTANDRPGPKKLGALAQQLKVGVAASFNRFDEYQFAKYDRAGTVRLRDALFLTHPKAKDAGQQRLFDKIAGQKLEVPFTWETQLSARGNSKGVWEELLTSGRVGYMALVRNLRNILVSGVNDEVLALVARTLADEPQVRRSKQMPVRFLSAYLEVQDLERAGPIKEALEKAVQTSALGQEFFPPGERILIAADVSGSMNQRLSRTGKVLVRDVGLLLASVLRSVMGASVTSGIFGTDWKVKNYEGSHPLRDTVDLRAQANEVGTATNGYKVLAWALGQAQWEYDRIVFFTDCQLYGSPQDQSLEDYWNLYRKKNPRCRVYFIDLTGNGTTPLLVDGPVHQVSGFSDQLFEMLAASERGDSIVETINAMDWNKV